MTFSFHRKEQWDLDCVPWLCVHVERTNAQGNRECQRVFCIWSRGIQIGSWLRLLDPIPLGDCEPDEPKGSK